MTTGDPVARADGGGAELYLTRVFNAPREIVFKAWTDPEQMKQWLGPRDFPAVHVEMDLRPGGAWRACLRPVHGGPDLWQGGYYREITVPEKLVYTFAWDEPHPAHGHEMLVTAVFTEQDGRTRLVFRQTGLPSAAERDGHQGGWTSTFDRLDDFLDRPAP